MSATSGLSDAGKTAPSAGLIVPKRLSVGGKSGRISV